MNKIQLKPVLSLGVASLCALGANAQKASNFKQCTPNIVLILMDDMGYGDIGRTGANQYETPNIDRLSAEGMQFTWYYTPQAVCSASRAGLLTGCYPNRIGFHGALMPWSKEGLSSKETTLAQMLKNKGYATGIIGKWHLGHQKEFLPLQHGFDEYYGLPYSNDMWPVDFDGVHFATKDSTNWRMKYPKLPLFEGNEKIGEILSFSDQDELTTHYTEKAVSFIESHKKSPFFLYMPHSMVHVPLGVSEKFRGKSRQGKFGDVMMEVDWSVGEILKALKKNGLDKNTLVIFTSDNGPWLNFGNHAGTTGGLREGKGSTWEGGQRVPCLMRWPGKIPGGTVCNKLCCGIDILPTLAAITGAPLPENKIDGVSILQLMLGEPDAAPRKTILYYYQVNSLEAVQSEYWKLVLPHTDTQVYRFHQPGKDGWPGPTGTEIITDLKLFDMRRDPGEWYDVAQYYPEKVDELLKLAAEARNDLGDDLTGNPGKNRRPAGVSDK
jgi:arylsulfatase A-like enzyme